MSLSIFYGTNCLTLSLWYRVQPDDINQKKTPEKSITRAIRAAVPNLVPAGIFLPAKAFPNARGILFGTKLIG
jgi:hypothetical protein